MPILDFGAIGQATKYTGGPMDTAVKGVGILSGLKQIETGKLQQEAAGQDIALKKLQITEATKQAAELDKMQDIGMAFPESFIKSPTGQLLMTRGRELGYVVDDPVTKRPAIKNRDLLSYGKLLAGKNQLAMEVTKTTMDSTYTQYIELKKELEGMKDKEGDKYKQGQAQLKALGQQYESSKQHYASMSDDMLKAKISGEAIADRQHELARYRDELAREKEKAKPEKTSPYGTAVVNGRTVPVRDSKERGFVYQTGLDENDQPIYAPLPGNIIPKADPKLIMSTGVHTSIPGGEVETRIPFTTKDGKKGVIIGTGPTKTAAEANAQIKLKKKIKEEGASEGVAVGTGGQPPDLNEPSKESGAYKP